MDRFTIYLFHDMFVLLLVRTRAGWFRPSDGLLGCFKSTQVKCIINSTEFGDIRYKPNGAFGVGFLSLSGVTTGTLKSLTEVTFRHIFAIFHFYSPEHQEFKMIAKICH